MGDWLKYHNGVTAFCIKRINIKGPARDRVINAHNLTKEPPIPTSHQHRHTLWNFQLYTKTAQNTNKYQKLNKEPTKNKNNKNKSHKKLDTIKNLCIINTINKTTK